MPNKSDWLIRGVAMATRAGTMISSDSQNTAEFLLNAANYKIGFIPPQIISEFVNPKFFIIKITESHDIRLID